MSSREIEKRDLVQQAEQRRRCLHPALSSPSLSPRISARIYGLIYSLISARISARFYLPFRRHWKGFGWVLHDDDDDGDIYFVGTHVVKRSLRPRSHGFGKPEAE